MKKEARQVVSCWALCVAMWVSVWVSAVRADFPALHISVNLPVIVADKKKNQPESL